MTIWGTHVTAMESLQEDHRLDIEAVSTVERIDPPSFVESIGWGALADSVRGLATPREAAYSLCARVNEVMTYQHGATGVHSSGEEAWLARAGVCQDFAHITLGALRTLGVPARNVSGYLAPQRDAEVGETSTGESHAWVEFWDGDWLAADPTNLTPVGADHVVVARGRDYQDVPPFKGVYSGPGVADLTVEVRFTRLSGPLWLTFRASGQAQTCACSQSITSAVTSSRLVSLKISCRASG